MTDDERLTDVLRRVAEGELGVDEAAVLLADTGAVGAGESDDDDEGLGEVGFGDPLGAVHFSRTVRRPVPGRVPVPPIPPLPPRPPIPPRPMMPLRPRGSSRTDLLLALARMGVTRDWLEALRETELADSDPETVIGLAACGVTPDWLRAAGEVELDGRTIVALAERGVTPDWLRAAGDAEVDPEPEALIGLAESGVTADLLPELLRLARQ